MIHSYAKEPFHNIIINDLDMVGLTLQEYRYDIPMFLLRATKDNVYSQGFINQSQVVKWGDSWYTLGELLTTSFNFRSLQSDFIDSNEAEFDTVKYGEDNNTEYYIIKMISSNSFIKWKIKILSG